MENKKIEDIIKIISKNISKDKQVIFLIESGSRAWGWQSKDSDYDIRGVFIQDYEKFTDLEEQINIKIDNLDIELWDLKKFLKLMIKSNPSVWEWLSSNIIYLDNPLISILRKEFEDKFSKESLIKHYISMAKQNFEKYINGIGDKANLKKYVYVLRSIACVNYIEKNSSPPPKNYKEVINYLPEDIKIFFEKIINDKKESESLEGNRNKDIEKYIVSFFDKKISESKSNFDIDKLNSIFRRIINGSK